MRSEVSDCLRLRAPQKHIENTCTPKASGEENPLGSMTSQQVEWAQREPAGKLANGEPSDTAKMFAKGDSKLFRCLENRFS